LAVATEADAMPQIRRARPWLGTLVEITVSGDGDAADLLRAVDAAFAVIAGVQAHMSVHDPASELSRLNRRAHLEAVTVGNELQTVLLAALQFAAGSDGAFDPVVGGRLTQLGLLPPTGVETEPSATWRDITLSIDGQVRFACPLRLDFGGIAKGYAVDCAIDSLRAHGVTQALVNAGGDLRALGATAQTIALRDPRYPGYGTHRLELRDRAVATSATYYAADPSQSTLIEPRTGTSLANGDSVTIVASTCMTADALTKVALFADADCLHRLLQVHDARLLVQAVSHERRSPARH